MDLILKIVLLKLLFFTLEIQRTWSLPDETDPEYWNRNAQNTLKDILNSKLNANIAKNVILFLGDGMGISTITAARIYKGQKHGRTGEEGSLSFDKFKDVALLKTYNVDSQVPDSAGTAAAFLSGIKSKAYVIGVDAKITKGDCKTVDIAKINSIASWCQDENKATGFVTTSRVTHASPAGLYGHSADRDWESDSQIPLDQRSPTCKDLAKQLIEDEPGRNLRVILGGGRRHFFPNTTFDDAANSSNSRTDNRDLVDEWLTDKRTRHSRPAYVANLEQFNKVNPKKTDFLLGLFKYSHMDYELNRDNTANGEPSLTEMTVKAIEILSKDPNGYFLFVEGARIDHANHDNLAMHALEDTYQFDKAVQAALDMVNISETLIVVTADHAHALKISGSQKRGSDILGIAENSFADGLPYTTLMYSTGPGYVQNATEARLNMTKDFKIDKTYEYLATVPRNWSAHGGEDVQVAAIGPMAHLFRGVQEQNYVAHVMAYAACVGRNKDHCKNRPTNDAVRIAQSQRSVASHPKIILAYVSIIILAILNI